ncbi:MAG: TonB-dependent receptor [Chlorobi bacterium]|nr:TonB-dependent receptor [Chlorobiota bacterium]
MLKVKILFFYLSFTIWINAQNASISGIVKDLDTGNGLPDVTIQAENTNFKTLTDEKGQYTLELTGGEKYTIIFELPGYTTVTRDVELKPGEKKTMSDITLSMLSHFQQDIPTISFTESGSENALESQSIHGLLNSSKDVFVSTAAYTFGTARFRIRGYDSDLSKVVLNGFIANEEESGRPYWSNWGGLNDVMRNTVITTDPSPQGEIYEPLGGVTNIITRASEYRPGTKVVYSNSNRTYRNRLMMTYSTGLLKNNWAFTFSYSRRWSDEGYVEATFYDANSFFASIEKKFGNKHSLNFTFLDAIYERGVGGASVQEVYDILDDNYYNPYWGYQGGEKRNSRVRSSNKPLFTLNHLWNISENTTLKSTVGYWFGKSGYTALNWQDVADPRPDYYRYLPSYYTDPADKERITELWQTDPSYSHINWDHFYYTNSKNLYTVEDAYGIEGNNVTGNRSKYIVEDRRNDISQFQFNSNFEHDFNSGYQINAGLNVDIYRGESFNEVDDLLGGDYWFDIDKFADRDFPGNTDVIQNDLNNPNNVVYEGDKFGHYYRSWIRNGDLWAIGKYDADKFSLYFGGNIKYTVFWRQGMFRKGLFPDNSYGDSEKQEFTTFGIKAGGEYRITGRHIINTNLSYGTRPPLFRNSFVSPRTRNDVVPGLTDETYYSADLSYNYRSPSLTARVTGYYTRLNDQVHNMNFYHEDLNTFVNYSMTGIDKEYKGFEIGASYKLTATISANMAAGIGRYLYKSDPKVIITQDNNQQVLETGEVYAYNFRLPGTPLTAVSLGLKYNSPKYWWVGVNGSYFDDIYIDFNPVPRSTYLYWSEPQKQDGAFILDAFIGKSWRIHGTYISLSGNFSNITNNTDFVTGGYEQLRFNPLRQDLHQPKYYYAYGFNYFVNLSVSF